MSNYNRQVTVFVKESNRLLEVYKDLISEHPWLVEYADEDFTNVMHTFLTEDSIKRYGGKFQLTAKYMELELSQKLHVLNCITSIINKRLNGEHIDKLVGENSTYDEHIVARQVLEKSWCVA